MLFKRFKERIYFLDTSDRTVWAWPNDGDWRHQTADVVLAWAHIDCGTWEREDYQELLELIVIFLGGVVKRIRKNSAVPVDISENQVQSIRPIPWHPVCIS